MLEYIVYLLACYSLTFAWLESPLFEKFRKKIKSTNSKISNLGKCYHCSGFWISLVVSVSVFNFREPHLHLLYALSSCIVSVILDSVVTLLDRINIVLLNKNKGQSTIIKE